MKPVTYYPYIRSAKYLGWGIDFVVIPGAELGLVQSLARGLVDGFQNLDKKYNNELDL